MKGTRRNPLEVVCEVLEKELRESEERAKRLDADFKEMLSAYSKRAESELSEEDLARAVKFALRFMTEMTMLQSIGYLAHVFTHEKPENVVEVLRHYIT